VASDERKLFVFGFVGARGRSCLNRGRVSGRVPEVLKAPEGTVEHQPDEQAAREDNITGLAQCGCTVLDEAEVVPAPEQRTALQQRNLDQRTSRAAVTPVSSRQGPGSGNPS
jgi:hypothetical protein